MKFDLIGVTRGRGFDGVVTRWGVTRLVPSLIEACERLLALGHGTQHVCSSRSLDLVKMDMDIVLKLTKKFIGWERKRMLRSQQ